MRVLALVHGVYFGPGFFADVVREAGHELVDWEASLGPPPDVGYDAVMCFGGRTHPDEEPDKPWLADELRLLQVALQSGTPLLGICLGAQLVARAAGGEVYPIDEPERGWTDVELTEAGEADDLFAAWPRRFRAFESHAYSYDPPPEAVVLARNSYPQAFRLGDHAWATQFHPEVTAQQAEDFILRRAGELGDPAAERSETVRQIETWNALGRSLCRAFLARAERG
jgi:GMP synthase-like glutamine amidotransferase